MHGIESGKVLKAKHKLSGKVIEFVKVGDKFSRVYFLGRIGKGK